jgi:hypothetical protein
MVLKIDFFQPRSEPCDLCGWLDDSGGVQLEDDAGVRRVFCHQCVVDLVKVCLGLPHGIAGAVPSKSCLRVASESQQQPIAKAC